MTPRCHVTLIAGLTLLAIPCTSAQNYHSEEAITANLREEFSPYVGRNYPTRPLFGDQHLHKAISVDAGTMCRLGQEEPTASPAARRSQRRPASVWST